MEIEVKFFKGDGNSKRLGGGYITSGCLKTNFSVWESGKSNWGFNVSLPYRKTDAGEFINEVQIIDKDAVTTIYKRVADQLGMKSEYQSEGTPEDSSKQTEVSIQDRIKKYGNKPPF